MKLIFNKFSTGEMALAAPSTKRILKILDETSVKLLKMAKSKKPGGSLRRYILSRFFLVLAIVSIVEIIVANIANTYLLPILFSLSQYNNAIKINGAEGLFIIIFVLVVTAVVNRISPILKVSPVEVNQFFENNFKFTA